MYQFTATHNAVVPGTLRTEWQYDSGSKINGGLAVVGETIFAGNFNGEAFALDANTGKLRWTSKAGNVVMTTPIITPNLVVVGTGKNVVMTDWPDRYIWAIPEGDDIIAYRARDGSLAWNMHTLGENMPSAGLIGSTLIFANGDMHAYAVDANEGRELWKVPMPGVDTMGSTAIDGSVAYVVASMGAAYFYSVNTHVLALSAATGKILWSAPYGNSDCSPTVAANTVFVEGNINYRHDPFPYGGYNVVYALDKATGAPRWTYRSSHDGYYTQVGSSERSVAGMYSEGVLYQSLPVSSEFVALRATTGSELWKMHTQAPVKMSAVERNGKLYFGDGAGLLYVVDARTGRVENVLGFKAPFTPSSPVIYGGTLFVANGGIIYAIPLDKL
jgi:outer membrane protein assembly factor BamB